MTFTTRIAVVLSGCGHLDGAEIRESVLALTSLDRHNAEAVIFAPDIAQHHVINHCTGKEIAESRNVLVEAARIARGAIHPLDTLTPEGFDGLVLPGGYGAAKNLSDIAFKGTTGTVLPEIQEIIRAFFAAKKPIGAICIAPAILAAALKGVTVPTVTIGDDGDGLIAGLGGKHQPCKTEDIAIDKEHKIVSCSAYMRQDRLHLVADGIEKLVVQLLAWTKA